MTETKIAHFTIKLFLSFFLLTACSGTIGTEVSARNTVSPISQTRDQYPLITNTKMEENIADADVIFVSVKEQSDNTWTFSVTVNHPDTGWDDYADGWDVVLPDGTVVKPDADSPFTRLLLHPHDNEQPFTRSQSGIIIPTVITQVIVRAHDIVDGFGGEMVIVDLTKNQGENFEVERLK